MAAPNSLDALNPEIWSSRIQVPLQKVLVALAIADTSLEKELDVGDKIHMGYIAPLTAASYTPGTAITFTGVTATDDYIDVTTKYHAAFYIDNIERMQAKPKLQGDLADRAAYALADKIDTDVLLRVTGGGGKLWGETSATAGTYATGATTANVTGITATSATIIDIFTAARKSLRQLNVAEMGDWIAILSADVLEKIEKISTEKGYNTADAAIRNGYIGEFMGFKLFYSPNLPSNHCYMGKKGAISLVMQQAPKMDIRKPSDKLGMNFIPYCVYGTDVLEENKSRFLDAWIST